MVEPEQPAAAARPARRPASPARLVLLSFLMLFVELGLIRWSGAYVVYLVVLHELRAARELPRRGGRVPPRPGAGRPLPLLPRPARGARPVPRGLPRAGRARRGSPAVRRRLRMAGAAEVALARRRLPPGVPDHGRDRRGRGAASSSAFEPLEAYRWDILGSILGIAAFSALSFLHASPFVWGVVAAAISSSWVRERARPARAARGRAWCVLGRALLRPGHAAGRPYYRVTTTRRGGRRERRDQRERPAASADHAARRHGGRRRRSVSSRTGTRRTTRSRTC